MLIAREELILAVVEGLLLTCAIVFALWLAIVQADRFIMFLRCRIAQARRERALWRILEGKECGPEPAE
jgi:hypothetical protein